MVNDKRINSVNASDSIATDERVAITNENHGKHKGRLLGLIVSTLVLVVCFSLPLWHLLQFAWESHYSSYIFLVPFVSLYMVWANIGKLQTESRPPVRLAAAALAGGSVVLLAYWLTVRSGLELAMEDRLALTIGAFLLFWFGVVFFFLGKDTLRAIRFPLGFLFFMMPIPSLLMHWIEYFLQRWSAASADWMFSLSGLAFIRENLMFHLPGITLEVAPECSGTQSTLALFLTSLLAGHLLLRTPWKRAVLTLVVLPLAILRNGFRIFMIGQLCVHIGPDMIHSPIHHRGGPLFFGLSLVPFFLLLFVLAKSDRPQQKTNFKPGGV